MRKISILRIARCLIAVACGLASASTRGADPQLFVTEAGVRSIDTVELFRNGIYWFTSSACTETYDPGSASFRAYTDARFLAVDSAAKVGSTLGGFTSGDLYGDPIIKGRASEPLGILLPGCGYGAYFARDDEAFYYARNRQLYRKPLTYPASAEGETINWSPFAFRPLGFLPPVTKIDPVATGIIGGSDSIIGGGVIGPIIRPTPVQADGVLWVSDTEVWSYLADLKANNLTINRTWKRSNTSIREVVTVPGVAIRKFSLADVVGTDGTYLTSYLLILTPDGGLYQSPVTGPAQLIHTGVSDFAVRNETYTTYVGPLRLPQIRHVTKLYYALGNLITYSGTGQLIAHSFTPGGPSDYVEEQAPAGFKITSVAVDQNRIFYTRTPSSGILNSDLRSRKAPAVQSLINIGDPSYATIAATREFRSLRSSGTYVYFAHRNTIQRIASDAPPLTIDFQSFGIEVTQGMQDMNNSVRLVAGKPVVVRGYAKLLANSTSRKAFDVPAQLHVYQLLGQGPVEVAGSPFLPSQAPLVKAIADLKAARSSLDATYQFEVPAEVLGVGTMRFQMVLNPGRAVPETVDNPLVNNTTSADLTVVQTQNPTLDFAVMSSTLPNYDPNGANSGFWDIIARARSLLPISDFRVFLRSGSITKPVVTITGIKGRSFSLPDDGDAALLWLDAAHVLDILGGDAPDNAHYVGMFPPGVDKFNGKGRRPGAALIMRMATDNNTGAAWNSTYGGRTLAHELSHNYGRKHIQNDTTCSSSVPDGPYDVLPDGASACTMGPTDLNDLSAGAGFDPISWSFVSPADSGDLMSYATKRWTSKFNWNALIDGLQVSPGRQSTRQIHALAATGDFLVIQGLFNVQANTAAFAPIYLMKATELNAQMLAELTAPVAESPVHLQLLDANGSVLVDQPVEPEATADEGSENSFIRRALPMDDAAATIRLVNDGAVLAEVAISAHAPDIELAAPVVDGSKVNLEWTASDQDGDSLLFAVQFSPDDGATWQTLNVNMPESQYSLDTALLAGSESARVRVIATDGVLTAMATSEPFAIGKHAPIAQISGVKDGQQTDFGSALQASGFAYDAEDGSLSGPALQWNLDGPEKRAGIGSNFSLSSLAPGSYTLTLTATDADGQAGVASVQFVVRALAVADGEEPILDGLAADLAYESTPSVRLPYGSGMYANARFAHANGALFVCINGIQYGVSPAAASVGVRLSLGGIGAGASAAGFAVDENGGLYRLAGGDDGLSPVADPPAGFRVVILRDDNTWSAELRISDDLLGGWNHSLGVTVVQDDGNVATAPAVWPPNSDVNSPATWSSASAGPLPPLPPGGIEEPPPGTINAAPIAKATSGAEDVMAGEHVTLDGSASSDPEGSVLTYVWIQTEGPSVVVENGDSPQPIIAAPAVTEAVKLGFDLIVNDGLQDSEPAHVEFTVQPATVPPPPVGSVEILSEAFDGSAFIIQCSVSGGGLLQIERATDLSASVWTPINEAIPVTDGKVQIRDETPSETGHAFYRAILSAPQ